MKGEGDKMMLTRVEQVVQRFQLDLIGEEGGGHWDGEGLVDVVIVGDRKEKPLDCPVGSCEDSLEEVPLQIPHLKSSCVPLGVTAPAASLKCLYTNASSVGNKQEDLEICMQSQGHDLIVIMKT